MTELKNRADLKFQPNAFPEPVKLDYSDIPSEEDMEATQNTMPQEALEDEGVLVSGERW